MKSINLHHFMMLLILAIGSSSLDAKSDVKNKEHKIQESLREIRKCIHEHGATEQTYKKLDALDAQAKTLCASCSKHGNRMNSVHEHTLIREIENVRRHADKHQAPHCEKHHKANCKQKACKNDVKIQNLDGQRVVRS